jgi:hypothetical protein
MDQLLCDVRVLQATGGAAVRYCARLFAALGARVVTIETPDDTQIGYAGHSGAVFGRWLDYRKRRAAAADIRIEEFDIIIGGQDAAGVASAQVWQERAASAPILLGLTWFDPTGPYGDWLGSDEIIAAGRQRCPRAIRTRSQRGWLRSTQR